MLIRSNVSAIDHQALEDRGAGNFVLSSKDELPCRPWVEHHFVCQSSPNATIWLDLVKKSQKIPASLISVPLVRQKPQASIFCTKIMGLCFLAVKERFELQQNLAIINALRDASLLSVYWSRSVPHECRLPAIADASKRPLSANSCQFYPAATGHKRSVRNRQNAVQNMKTELDNRCASVPVSKTVHALTRTPSPQLPSAE